MKVKTFLILATIVIFLAIVALNYDIISEKIKGILPTGNDGNGNDSNNETTTTTTSGINKALILGKGSKGAEVAELQRKLNTIPPLIPVLAIDGIFGARTEAKVKSITDKTTTSINEIDEIIYTKSFVKNTLLK